MKKYIFAIVLFLLGIATQAKAGFTPLVGEELTYEVSYMGIKLGTIVISTDETETYNGNKCYITKADISTYKSIPFLDIKVLYNAFTDKSITCSHRFLGKYKSGGYSDLHKIYFNYDKKNIYISKENANGKYFEKSFQNTKKFADGLTLFFMARNFLTTGKKITIPTIVDKDLASTEISFTGKTQGTNCRAVKYPVATKYFSGLAHWTGVYGLSGTFEGWFSNDDARVPIKAKLQLYLGSADVELIKYKRKGWTPPESK